MRAEVEQKAIDVEMLPARIEQAQVLAPFAGAVRYTDGEIGQMIEEYAPAMGLADPGALEVKSSLPSDEELPKLRPGQAVAIIFRVYPQREVTGRLIQVTTPTARAERTKACRNGSSFPCPTWSWRSARWPTCVSSSSAKRMC